jgi:phage-related protein
VAEEEDYGRAVIRVDLDETAAEAEARTLGPRIQRALNQATRGLGKQIRNNIQQGLRGAALTATVTPDLNGFADQVRTALAGTDLEVPVSPDLTGFQDQVRAALGSEGLSVPVSPDLGDFQARVTAALASVGGGVSVPVSPDLGDFQARVSAALSSVGGGVTVPVVPDTAGFEAAVRAALDGLSVTAEVTPDVARFQTRLNAAVRALGAVARVQVEPDADRFRTSLQGAVNGLDPVTIPATVDADRFAARLRRAVRRIEVAVRTVPDLDRFEARLRVAVRRMTAAVTVEPNLSRFAARLRLEARRLDAVTIQVRADAERFRRELERALRGLPPITVRVDPDLSRLNDAIRTYNAPTINVPADLDRNRLTQAFAGLFNNLRGLAGRAAGALGGLLKLGAVGIAAAGAAQGVGLLLAALAPAAGIIAALPAAALTSVAAFGALKLALDGVGDAFSAALTEDAEKFEETLEGLSPKAQAAAREVRALKPAFDELKNTVQDAFFAQFEGQITKTANALGGTLRAGLKSIATGFGEAAAEGLKFLQSQRAITDLKAIFTGTSDAVGGLSGAIQPVLQGLLDISAAVSLAFGKQLGEGITSAGTRLGEFLTRAADSGRAVTAVSEAVAVFRQLRDLLGNLGGIIRGVFQAGEEAGAGFLANLVTITGKIEEFVKSDAGQSALQNLFATIGTIAAQLGPIFTALIAQVGAIAPALAPVFVALGPALVNLINALGPALAAIGPSLATVGTALADAFAALSSGGALTSVGQVIGSLLTGLAPLLPLVGSLANTVLAVLAPAFQAVLAALNPVITALVGALMPILPVLTSAFQQILTAVIPLGTALGQLLGQAVASLGPLLSALAAAVAQVVVAFIPFVQAVIAALLPVMPPLLAAFQAILGAILPLVAPIGALLASLGGLAAKVVELLAPLLQFVAVVAQAVAVNILVPIIDLIVGALSGLADILTTVVGYITSFVDAAIAGFQYLYDVLVGNSIIPDLINSIVSFFTSLPGKALAALSSLVSSVVGVFTRMASSALSSITSFISRAIGFLRGLPGKARAALSSAKSALVSAGKDLILGMIQGIKSAAGSLVSAAKDVVGGAIDGAKNLLGIDSPSKVFIEIGKDTGKGFVVGLTGTASEIEQTIKRMTDQIAKAFKGQTSKVDDRLIDLLSAGNKRLQALADQRDRTIKQIEEANKFAAETTKQALSLGSLQTLTQGTEEQNTDTLLDGITRAIRRVKSFTKEINALAKRGLRRDLLQQVVQLGPEEGAALARSLNEADKGTLKRLNELQGNLVKASDKLGKDSADALFDAGKKAGEGFLAGLKGQRKAIEQLMLDIARALQKSIRSALRIKSPSRVFMEIGDLTGEGLELGFLDRIAALQKTAVSAADDVAEGVAASFALLPALITQSLGGVNTDVLQQLRSALPSSVRGFLPFANGGEVDRPVIGLLGEAGREVVIPMTRPSRARELADSSGLTELLLGAQGTGRGIGGKSVVQNNTFEIREVGDGHVTAQRVVNRLTLAASGL